MIGFQCRNMSCYAYSEYEDGLAPYKCPECNSKIYRLIYLKEPKKKSEFVNIAYPDNERWSWSMGVNVQDIPAMMKKYPDREYHPQTGQLKVKHRPHKKKLMREHGMEEY